MLISRRRPRAGELLFVAVVVVVAAALRFRSLGWGLPELPEEATPFRKAIGFWGVDSGRMTLDPHFFNYPSLTFYFHFLLQAAWWFGGLASGAWHSLDQFRTALATDPAPFILLARRATALTAAFTVVPVYLAGRKLAGIPGAVAAAVFLALNPLHVAQSRYIGTDIPLAFCTAMALLAILDVASDPERRSAVAAGIWTGLAASCKYPGIILLVPLVAATLASRRMIGTDEDSEDAGASGTVASGAAAASGAAGETGRSTIIAPPATPASRGRLLRQALVAAAAAFAVTSPFVIIDLPEALRSLAFERHHMMVGHLGGSTQPAILRYASNILPYALGWPGLVVVAAALALLAVRRGPGRLVALFALAGLAVIGSWRVAADRYLLLVMPALVIAAGAGLAAAMSRLRANRAAAALAGVLAIIVAAPGAVTAWREGTVRGMPSTRAAAEQWVRRNVPRGALVAAENYSVEAVSDSLPVLVIPFDAVHPHVYDPAYSLPYYTPFEYVVLSSGMYDRYLARPADFPAQLAFYEGIARDYEQLAVFEPGRDTTGPTIRVFRRKAGVSRNDLRNISGAFYNQVGEKKPLSRFLTSMAAVLSKGGRGDLALAAAEQAVTLTPEDPKSLTNMAALRAARGDYLTALKTYERALEISPDDAILHYNMGRLYEGKELYAQAVASFVRAINSNPRLPDPYLSLAICQVRMHEYGAARGTLKRFLELFPAHPQAGQARRTLEELR